MKQFARRSRLTATTAAATAAALVTAAAMAAPALAAAPLTVSSAWGEPDGSNQIISPGLDDSIAYTVKAASGTLYDVGFTDTLPASLGVVVDTPVGATYSGCGSGISDANSSGSGTITVSGLTITAGTTCTVSVNVVAKTPGTAPDAISGITYATSEGGAADTSDGTASDATLQVLHNPTISVTTPKKAAVYKFGQKVSAAFTCTETDFTQYDPVTGCVGFDENYNEVDDGDYLDTLVAGRHQLDVQAYNIGGADVDRLVTYTVKPFTLSAVRSSKAHPLSYSVTLPDAGKLTTTLTHGRTKVGSLTTRVAKAGKVSPSVKLNAVGRKLLAKSRKRTLSVRLSVRYAPKGVSPKGAYFFVFSPRPTTVTKPDVTIR